MLATASLRYNILHSLQPRAAAFRNEFILAESLTKRRFAYLTVLIIADANLRFCYACSIVIMRVSVMFILMLLLSKIMPIRL